jgi:hypothetical protein
MSYPARPYWFGKKQRLLEIPLSVGFVGWLKPWGRLCSELSVQYPFKQLRVGGLLARTGLLNKTWLSPEGYTLKENLALLRSLYGAGVRTFSFAFHSPSLEPGNTPYVTSQKDLERFLTDCRHFFDFFMGEFDGAPTTPLELRTHLSIGSANHFQERQ